MKTKLSLSKEGKVNLRVENKSVINQKRNYDAKLMQKNIL